MSSESTSKSSFNVQAGDQVIIKKANVLKCFEVRRNRTVSIERAKLPLDSLIGFTWGTVFEVNKGKVEKLSVEEALDDDGVELDEAKDNRGLVDARSNQKLTREEIHNMKQEGAKGQDIVENLIENSATFSQKTEFAQQKYIKKKKKKHEAIFTVLKPTTRLVAQMYFNRGPNKILSLRMDSIAQILTYGNVHSGCKIMLIENCIGLLLGAVMERLGGVGELIQLFSGTAPIRQALEVFNFPKEYSSILSAFPLNEVASLKRINSTECSTSQELDTAKTENESAPLDQDSTKATVSALEVENNKEAINQENSIENPTHPTADAEMAEDVTEDTADINMATNEEDDEGESSDKQDTAQRKRRWEDLTEEEKEQRKLAKKQALQKTRETILKADKDALIVASKHHPRPIVLELMDYVLPSRPIVVFCQHKEPLLDCYMALRDKGGVISLRLTETWLREYQVLPNRSHPEINMSGTGGYLLTAIKVAS